MEETGRGGSLSCNTGRFCHSTALEASLVTSLMHYSQACFVTLQGLEEIFMP